MNIFLFYLSQCQIRIPTPTFFVYFSDTDTEITIYVVGKFDTDTKVLRGWIYFSFLNPTLFALFLSKREKFVSVSVPVWEKPTSSPSNTDTNTTILGVRKHDNDNRFWGRYLDTGTDNDTDTGYLVSVASLI